MSLAWFTKAVLVAQPVAVRPPGLHVGVAAAGTGDVDRGPPLDGRVGVEVVVVQLVHALEVEAERPPLAVDLEAVGVVVAGREPARLEAGDRAAAEPGEEDHRVVHRAGTLGPGRRRAGAGDLTARRTRQDLAFGDERVLDRSLDRHHLFTGHEADRVDDVRVEVAVGSGTGDVALEAPQQRGVGTAPALQVGSARVVDAAQRAGRHQPLRQGHRRHAPVVEPDEGLAARARRGVCHALGVGERAGERLLAGHVLAGLERGDRLLRVHVVRGGDVDQADLRGLARRSPGPSTMCCQPHV